MAEMEEPKTKDDIKQLLKHLEDEHRKANISDKTYKELKEKYKSQMSYMDNSVADENPQSMEEIEPEQAAAQQATTPAPVQAAAPPEEEKKGGLFGGLMKKKAAAPAAAVPQVIVQQSNDSTAMIEIEKIKTMLDTVRDQKKSTDESIQSIFESIGEVRSMSIQNDANEREINSKLEKIMDDVANLRPKEVERKFNQINESLEKYQLIMEKLQAKTDDMAEKLNKLTETFRVIGNTENLANINSNVQSKLADIQEAMNYTERLASKAEKLYIDLKMELEDIVIYKSKQEGMEEAVKDLLKTMDAMNTKFDNYTTKKDLENERQDIMILNKETESIKGALALVQTNVPEPILNLRKEREDINLFLDSLEEQRKAGKITIGDYENIKKKNLEKLKAINESLDKEWKKFERLVEHAKSLPPAPEPAPAAEEAPEPAPEPAPVEEAPAPAAEEAPEPAPEPPVPQPPVESTPPEPPATEEELAKEELQPEPALQQPASNEEMVKSIKEEMQKGAEPEPAPAPKKKVSKKKSSLSMPF